MTLFPKITQGDAHTDPRGRITFNNTFDATAVKRIYTLENAETGFVRGWQGHKVEQRWFAAMSGKFTIDVVYVLDWERPEENFEKSTFELSSETLDVLHVPQNCLTAIQAVEDRSKLLVMADYGLGEIQDEYRFDIGYFK